MLEASWFHQKAEASSERDCGGAGGRSDLQRCVTGSTVGPKETQNHSHNDFVIALYIQRWPRVMALSVRYRDFLFRVDGSQCDWRKIVRYKCY